jgi:ABC-2 type transport system permease protein
VPSGFYVGIIHYLAPPGAGPQVGPVLAGYLGNFLVGAFFIAIGVFTSAVTRNQIVASILCFAACILLFVAGIFEYFVGPELKSTFAYFNLWDHMQAFGKGLVDTRHVVYYVSGTLFALYASVKVLDSRRWR